MIHDDLIGQQLANFKIEKFIGRGGMAKVYFGHDVKLDRPVAIKVIDARHRENPSYAERFVREARSIAKWRHEHIVQVYYADDTDGFYYYVMEYVDGQDLATIMAEYQAKGQLLPAVEVIRIGHAFASALDYAHQKGIVHRDVKPSNLMVSKDGRIVLTDFGLALDTEQGSMGKVLGTARYVSPEQAHRSADAVAQSDLYSLGVIFYEMLTGHVPFDDPSPTSLAIQHITQPPPNPREFNPSLNTETEGVLLKILSKSPAERYQSGAELVGALQKALQVSSSAIVPDKPLTAENLIGQQLDEYRLDVLLGRGGMGRVYRGLDTNLDRTAAIKVIDTPFAATESYKERFKREAKAVARLKHANIVSVYRAGEANGLLYIAMEYIEGSAKGKDLQALLAAYRKTDEFIPLTEVLRLIGEVNGALDYAHSKQVIHRDVKPANIMLDKDGHAFLADFGLTLLVDEGTRGEILGSLHYLAPEQAISSSRAVPQSDLYALGVILFEMLTGQVPFDASEPTDVAIKHINEPPPAPRTLRPDLSPAVEAVVLKALAKEPTKRYQTGAAFTEALAKALQPGAEISGVFKTSAVYPTTPPPPKQAKPKMILPELPPIPAIIADPESATHGAPSLLTGGSDFSNPLRLVEEAKGGKGKFYVMGAVIGLLLLLGLFFWFSGGQKEIVAKPTSTATETATTEPTATLTTMPTPTEIISPTAEITATLVPTATATMTATEVITATPTVSATETPAIDDNSMGYLTLWWGTAQGRLAPGQTKWYAFNSKTEVKATIIAFVPSNSNVELVVFRNANGTSEIGKGNSGREIDQNQYTTDLFFQIASLGSEQNTNFYIRLVNRGNRTATYCMITRDDKKSCP